MKVLFVVNSLVGGGAEKVFMDFLYNLDRSRFDVTVLCIDDIGIYRENVKKIATYKTIIRHAKKPRILHYFLGGLSAVWAKVFQYMPSSFLYRVFIHEKYDIEIAYLEGMATKLVAGSNNPKSVKYAWVHTDMIQNPWTQNQFRNEKEEKWCYHQMNRVVAVSAAVKSAADKKFDIHSSVRYNILDDAFIRNIVKTGKRDLGRRAEIAFVSVGSLWKVKGYVRLVKVFEKILKRGYDIELHIIGTGEDEGKIKEYIEHHRLNTRILLHGFQQAPYELLAQGDVYVCPSYVEGFSTSVTEALILGLPVITTDCAGMRELLGDSEFGYITENSEKGLEEGILHFLEHREQMDHYRNKSKERGREFSVQKKIAELESMFAADHDKHNKGQRV